MEAGKMKLKLYKTYNSRKEAKEDYNLYIDAPYYELTTDQDVDYMMESALQAAFREEEIRRESGRHESNTRYSIVHPSTSEVIMDDEQLRRIITSNREM